MKKKLTVEKAVAIAMRRYRRRVEKELARAMAENDVGHGSMWEHVDRLQRRLRVLDGMQEALIEEMEKIK